MRLPGVLSVRLAVCRARCRAFEPVSGRDVLRDLASVEADGVALAAIKGLNRSSTGSCRPSAGAGMSRSDA